MSTRNMQGVVSPIIPASIAGGSNYSGVYTLDQLNRLNAVYPNHIGNSLRFRSSASAYLNRTPSVAGNRQTWTWSGWVKRGSLGANRALFSTSYTSLAETYVRFNSSDQLDFTTYTNGGSNYYSIISTQVFRDPSAWYFVEVVFDTTSATASNRMRLYVNGVQITSFASSAYPPQNYTGQWNDSAYTHYIGAYEGTSAYFDGYMAEVNFIDGQALDPSYFGQIYYETGVWCPKRYTGTYGTNGFYLKFTDTTSTTTLCYDYSGNSNNWTPNNISLTAGSTYDSMLDSPTNYDNGGNGVGNYAVLNPLEGSGKSNGNLSLAGQATGTSTIQVSSGKWYVEYVIGSTLDAYIGVQRVNTSYVPVAYRQDGTRYTGSAWVAYGASYSAGDVISMAFDLDAGTAQFFKNNTSQGVISGVSYSTICGVTVYVTTSNSCVVNFGQRPFAYTPPTGFKSLCTQNLPAPAIYNGANHMAATLYTGTGTAQSIVNTNSGVSFQPDFVWIKSRSAATDHALYDVIRGTQNRLESNTTDAAVAADNGLTAFGSSGFTVNTLAQVNTSAATYVGWQWKAGGTAVTNTAGSITSQVSANTTAGFSVVTYTGNGTAGATVGHGLGVAPSMVIVKPRVATTTADSWCTGHTSIGWGSFLELNSTNAATAASNRWNSTAPTSSLITLGSVITDSGKTYVAYCFAAIPGYSAFGSYTGNGSSDGPFVYTGFRPRWILVKRTDVANSWVLMDSSRSSFNYADKILWPNLSDAEANGGTTTSIDFVSNGFKQRGAGASINASGGTYIYAAFAENPFQYSLAR